MNCYVNVKCYTCKSMNSSEVYRITRFFFIFFFCFSLFGKIFSVPHISSPRCTSQLYQNIIFKYLEIVHFQMLENKLQILENDFLKLENDF